ncbi:MAG: hypothetical protein IT385_25445 [Deltaproteobacteria bacterium]|nr:hypothetical protein [Deltaproteobacteria bacterium]
MMPTPIRPHLVVPLALPFLVIAGCDDAPAEERGHDASDASTADHHDAPDEQGAPIGRWEPVGRLARARFGHSATRLPDDRVLVAGGVAGVCPTDSGEALASVERVQPDGAVIEGAPLGEARAWHGAVALDAGRVLVAGGRRGDAPLASAEIYDVAADRWDPIAPLGVAQLTLALAPHGEGGAVSVGYDGAIEILGPDLQWRPAPIVAGALGVPIPVALGDGRVALVGRDASVIVSADGASTTPLAMPEITGDLGAASVDGGVLLVARAPTGAFTEAGPVQSARAFFWSAGSAAASWVALGDLPFGQAAFTLVDAPTGAVFGRAGWGAWHRWAGAGWSELAATGSAQERALVPLSDGTVRLVGGSGNPTCAAVADVLAWSP